MPKRAVFTHLRAPRLVGLAVAAAAVAARPGASQAHRWLGGIVVDPCPPPVVVEPQASAVWVEPVYRTVLDRQWVGPTYQTVAARVWVPPVTVAAAPQRVFVADRFAWRTVVAYDHRGQPYPSREWVVVVPGHYDDAGEASVVVTPGHYEDVTRQLLVCDGHWATVDRPELVARGHWETRVDAVAVPVYPPPLPLRIRLPY